MFTANTYIRFIKDIFKHQMQVAKWYRGLAWRLLCFGWVSVSIKCYDQIATINNTANRMRFRYLRWSKYLLASDMAGRQPRWKGSIQQSAWLWDC